MKRNALLTLLLLGACKGGGSEIGPVPPAQPKNVFSGQILAANGSPVVGASILIEGQTVNATGVSDRWGRFRIPGAASGDHTLIVDGRTGASRGVGESFPRFRVPVTVNGSTPLSKPVVLPNLASAVGQAEQKTVAIGTTLGASDNLTISGAGLTLTLDGARVDWSDPSEHVGETEVTISAAILSSEQCPVPLETSGVNFATALVLWIDPADIVFTIPASLSFTTGFFPDGASGVFAFRYDLPNQLWFSPGNGIVSGGVITATGAVTQPEFFVLGSVCTSTTTVVGRAVDGSGTGVAGVLVSAPGGFSAVTGSNGAFSIPDICAVDGNGASLSGTVRLTANSTQLFTTTSASETLVGGGVTDFGDLLLLTQPAGEIHFLLIQEGLSLPDREISVGSHLAGFGARAKTGGDGIASFFEVPALSGQVFQALTAKADPTTTPMAVDAGGKFFAVATYHGDALFTGPADFFQSVLLGGSLLVTVLREDSDAPIEGAFVMVGTDPTTNLQGFTSPAGQISFSVSGTPTVTAGVQTIAAAGGGSGFDQIRMTAFRSVKAVNASSLVIRLPVAQRSGALTQPWDPFGRVAGSASGLTDPTVTAPINGSGTYAIDLHASPAGDALQLFTALGERSDFDLLTPAGTDPSAGYTSGGMLDDGFTIDAPRGEAFLVGIERDAAVSTAGPITRFGVSGPVQAIAGATVTASLALDHAVDAGTIPFSVPGMESGLAAALMADLGVEFADGKGALLGEAGDQLSGFDFSTGAASLLLPALSGALTGGAYRLRVYGETDLAGVLRRQDVFLRSSGSAVSGAFLAVPEFSVPTPGGSFDPTGAGIEWVSSDETLLHRVRVSRSESVTEDGLAIRDDFDWQVYTPSGDRSFAFPTLPGTSGDETVPGFFGSGQTFSIEIRALEAELFEYGPFLANTARVRIAEMLPEAESVFRASATTP